MQAGGPQDSWAPSDAVQSAAADLVDCLAEALPAVQPHLGGLVHAGPAYGHLLMLLHSLAAAATDLAASIQVPCSMSLVTVLNISFLDHHAPLF